MLSCVLSTNESPHVSRFRSSQRLSQHSHTLKREEEEEELITSMNDDVLGEIFAFAHTCLRDECDCRLVCRQWERVIRCAGLAVQCRAVSFSFSAYACFDHADIDLSSSSEFWYLVRKRDLEAFRKIMGNILDRFAKESDDDHDRCQNEGFDGFEVHEKLDVAKAVLIARGASRASGESDLAFPYTPPIGCQVLNRILREEETCEMLYRLKGLRSTMKNDRYCSQSSSC